MKEKAKILDEEGIRRALMRIAHEIIEKNRDLKHLVIVGIHTRGAYLAKRLKDYITAIESGTAAAPDIPTGSLGITFYRDDLSLIGPQPVVHKTEIKFDIEGKTIILVDDVLYTGRTIRCAFSELMDFGRPRAIQLAVLIDRGHRELPIRADYVGKNVPTALKEEILVRISEVDGKDEVVIVEKD